MQIKEGRTVSLTFKNQPKGELIIQKRDSATGQLSPGPVPSDDGRRLRGGTGRGNWRFHPHPERYFYDRQQWRNPGITNLAPGAYVISEIRSPSGYVMDAPSTNVVIGENGDTQTVVIKNSKAAPSSSTNGIP